MLTENPALRLLTNKSQLAYDKQAAQGFVIPDKMIDKAGSGDGVHLKYKRGSLDHPSRTSPPCESDGLFHPTRNDRRSPIGAWFGKLTLAYCAVLQYAVDLKTIRCLLKREG